MQGIPEKTFRMKLTIVHLAARDGMIEWNAPTSSYRMITSGTVNTKWAGDLTFRSVKTICNWGNRAFREDWEGFSQSVDMQTLYGCQDPLTVVYRLPDVWSKSRSTKKGRNAFDNRYPREMKSLQDELVRLHKEHRDSSKGDAPWSVDMEWLYNTWNSLTSFSPRQQ